MPREARKISCSGFYHVMIRGVNKEPIFKDDRDRETFLRLLKHYKIKLDCVVHAYCLMNNHVHILIEDNNNKLGEFMRNVASVYAGEFNKKYKRIGHLFQERFKSQNVENDYYLLRLIRYIHRNPEKAGICKTEEYKWSSYREYIHTNRIIEKEYILSKYNINFNQAIKLFKDTVLSDKEDNIDDVYIENEITKDKAIDFIKYILNISDVKCIFNKEKKEKIEMAKKIKKTGKVNNKLISEIFGLNKNLVGKIK